MGHPHIEVTLLLYHESISTEKPKNGVKLPFTKTKEEKVSDEINRYLKEERANVNKPTILVLGRYSYTCIDSNISGKKGAGKSTHLRMLKLYTEGFTKEQKIEHALHVRARWYFIEYSFNS